MNEKLEYYFLSFLLWLSRWLPKSWIYGMMNGIAMLLYYLIKRRREITIQNLHFAFPKKSEEEIRQLSKTVYSELSQTVAEILLILTDRFDVDTAVINREEVLERLAQFREKYPEGWILMTAHFSNWELLGQFLSKNGYEMLILGREADNKLIDEKIIVKLREKYGSRAINKRRSSVAVLKRLKRAGIVGVLIDQKVGKELGIRVKFFGRDVYMTTMVASMQEKVNATVVPMFVVREARGRYRMILREPIKLSGNKEEMTQKYSDIMEKVIQKYPSQWFWMHNRWKKES